MVKVYLALGLYGGLTLHDGRRHLAGYGIARDFSLGEKKPPKETTAING
jgi:hypothetical protein